MHTLCQNKLFSSLHRDSMSFVCIDASEMIIAIIRKQKHTDLTQNTRLHKKRTRAGLGTAFGREELAVTHASNIDVGGNVPESRAVTLILTASSLHDPIADFTCLESDPSCCTCRFALLKLATTRPPFVTDLGCDPAGRGLSSTNDASSRTRAHRLLLLCFFAPSTT